MLWNLLIVVTLLTVLFETSGGLGGIIYVAMGISLYLLIRDFVKTRAKIF